jgi:hypothetical protein
MAFKRAPGINFEEISRWAWHVPAYKTAEPIIRQCSMVRLLGILGYKTLSYIPIYSVAETDSKAFTSYFSEPDL